ncbi:MAG: outer membrane lipoprotein chaperone LolA [Gammaproteobacteria bacterium]|nr:outer membrane lipoprotein chaperone LolA [Gammaproteobacteria bacterium]
MTLKTLSAFFAIVVVAWLGPVQILAIEPDAEEVVENSERAWSLLDAYLTGVTTMRARFRQILLDENQQIVQNASGTLVLKRPGQFRWDYQDPYEQLILSDGTHLWLYDPDLDQVTVKSLDDSLASTPAMLLSGDADMTDGFELTEAGQYGEVFWMTLVPRNQETDFRNISLGFVDGQLQLMELEDSLDQLTRILLQEVERNPILADDTFSFVPPAGSDVIGELPVAGQDDQ